MTEPVTVSLLGAKSSHWSAEVDRLRRMLGAPNQPLLFPPHFLYSTFPKIGGEVVTVSRGGELCGAGTLFPRGVRNGRRIYTLRFHAVGPEFAGDQARLLLADVSAALGGAKVVFYDPAVPHHFTRTGELLSPGIDIGIPDAEEAQAVRRLQQVIWGGEPDGLYPADLHSTGFGAGTTLVARKGGEVVGFLFGFYRFAGSPLPELWDRRYGGDLRLESQLLGVLPQVRKQGVGFLLKKAQAQDAQRQGIGIVNWTVDPLQYTNAILNFGRLKALAIDYYPDYYTFRNSLNQVVASRFGMTWLVQTERVRAALEDESGATILNLRDDPSIARVNEGGDAVDLEATTARIAVEVPANWTNLQREDREQALHWREATDRLFGHYLGSTPDKYAVTSVGEDGDRKYLIAERVTPEFVARIAE